MGYAFRLVKVAKLRRFSEHFKIQQAWLSEPVCFFFWLHWGFLVLCAGFLSLLRLCWLLFWWNTGSRVYGLSSCGAWASLPSGVWDLSSPTKDQTHVLYIGRWILNHWTTRNVPPESFRKFPELPAFWEPPPPPLHMLCRIEFFPCSSFVGLLRWY